MTEQPQTPEEQGAADQEPAPSSTPAPPTAEAAPPLSAAMASADGSTTSSLADERPEVLAGAAFAGGFLAALLLKRLVG